MDITIDRNAFGRQVDSFETDLDIPQLKFIDPNEHPFHAVFIRAPLIQSVGDGVEVLASLAGWPHCGCPPESLAGNRFPPGINQ